MKNREFESTDLPPMPQVVAKIIQIDENNIDVSSDQLQSLISVDPALTSKILKIANSAFYARVNKVTNVSQAITMLGFKTIKSLTLLVSTRDLFPNRRKQSKIQKELWMRSVLSALISKIIAERMSKRKIQEEAFMSALLKNIGKLILYNKAPEEYEQVLQACERGGNLRALAVLEEKHFGLTSNDVAVKAMEKWNFPADLIDVARVSTDNLEQVREVAGEIGLIAHFADVVVLMKNFTEAEEFSLDVAETLEELFRDYTKALDLKLGTIEYLRLQIQDEIRDDEFYSFCSELFSS